MLVRVFLVWRVTRVTSRLLYLYLIVFSPPSSQNWYRALLSLQPRRRTRAKKQTTGQMKPLVQVMMLVSWEAIHIQKSMDFRRRLATIITCSTN